MSVTSLEGGNLGSVRCLAEFAELCGTSGDRAALTSGFVRVAVECFSDLCAVHLAASDVAVSAWADRRPAGGSEVRASLERAIGSEAFERVLQSNRAAVAGAPETAATDGLSEATACALLGSLGLGAAIVVPLATPTTSFGAALFAADRFATTDVHLAVAMGRQLALALANVAACEREDRATQRFQFLARITDGLFATLDPTAMLQRVLNTLVGELADWAVAASLTPSGLRIIATSSIPDERGSALGDIRNARVLTEEAEYNLIASLRARRSLVSNDQPLSELQRLVRPYLHAAFESLRPRAEMTVPLFVGDTTYGAITCYSSTRQYERADLELLEEVGRRASLALEHAESFARERRLAKTLQQATLPAQLPRIRDAALTAVYSPAALEALVGGDWYDAFDLDDDRILLTIGDVTGHGVQASVIMGKLRHALNVIAMYESDPSRIIDAAERIVLRRYPDAIATAFVAVYDARRKTLTYANAGHPPPILRLRDGTLKELVAEGLPIGIRQLAASGGTVTGSAEGAALLVLYTDGLTESTRDPLEGRRALFQALASDAVLYVSSPAEYVQQRCLRTPASDDVAMLVLNFVRVEQWSFDAENARAAQDARGDFLAFLRRQASPESDFASAELIFGELVGNVVRHAPGPIDIALEWVAGQAVLHVIDRGPGFVPRALDASDLLREDGRGLWMIQQVGEGLSVEATGCGSHVRVVLPVRSSPSRIPAAV